MSTKHRNRASPSQQNSLSTHVLLVATGGVSPNAAALWGTCCKRSRRYRRQRDEASRRAEQFSMTVLSGGGSSADAPGKRVISGRYVLARRETGRFRRRWEDRGPIPWRNPCGESSSGLYGS